MFLFEKEKEKMITLDSYFKKTAQQDDYDFINIDVQGYELNVFKGAVHTLKNIKYIMSEVNRDEIYKNCARVEQLDVFLGGYNFKRVSTTWDNPCGVDTWGDAFYIKQLYKFQENLY